MALWLVLLVSPSRNKKSPKLADFSEKNRISAGLEKNCSGKIGKKKIGQKSPIFPIKTDFFRKKPIFPRKKPIFTDKNRFLPIFLGNFFFLFFS